MTAHDEDDDRDLLAKIDLLPRELEPGRDLWRGVEGTIQARRASRRRGVALGGLALAAAALLLLGALRHGTHGAVAGGDAPRAPASSVAPAPAVSAPAAPPAAVARELVPEEASYRAALAALAPTLAARKSQLPAADAAKVETGLRALEAARSTTRAALAEHPDDPDLRAELDAEYEQEIQTMNDVLDWTTRS